MICHVYKRGRLYWGKLHLEHESRLSRVSLGTSDKRVAQQKLAEIAKEREKEAAGLLAPRSARDAAVKPLPDLLAAFLDDLQVKGRAHATEVKYRKTLGKLFTRCCWRTFGDVTARSFCEWRAKCGLSPKTLNDLLGAMMTFSGWLVHQRMAVENPLAHVQRIDTRATSGQFRRALDTEQLRRLLDVSPPDRRMVYLLAAYTGLRRSEMQGLRWSDVSLDELSPLVRVRANMVGNKSRKLAVLPLHPEVAVALRVMRSADAAPFQLVFSHIPRVRTFRKDLVAAEISFEDEQGRRCDFHSLRMTFGTNLTVSGASPRVVMELMRHSDIKLTMKIYTDSAQLNLISAVRALAPIESNSCHQRGMSVS